MITAALICYYGMGWGFIEICEHFLGHDWRGLLNDIAQQKIKLPICISVPLLEHQNKTQRAANRQQTMR